MGVPPMLHGLSRPRDWENVMPPTALIENLEGLRRRVRMLSVAYGLGLVVAATVGALLAAILLDYLLNLPGLPRFAVALAAAGAVGYVLYRWVVRPLLAKMTLSDVAGRLETAFPQFDDRLRSTVNFLGNRGGDSYGSDAMKDRVITEASTLAGQLDLNRAIVMTPVRYSLAAAAAALLLAVLLAATVNPLYRSIALARLFAPFGDAAWPKRVQIDLASHVPERVPVGQRVDLRMKLAKGDKASMKAIVLYQYGDGPWQQELMTRGADGTYAASLDAKVDAAAQRGTMKVRLKAGDDLKEIPSITVLPRLAVRQVEAVVTPPPYVGAKQPTAFNLASGPALVPGGSTVELRVAFNKPLAAGQEVEILPVSEQMKLPPIAWAAAGEAAVSGTWTAAESLRFHVKATDVDGFRNSALEEYELIVRPDQQPTVQIEVPRRNEERTPVAVVPLQGVAEDDYGIENLKLVVDRLGDKKHWEVELVNTGGAAGGVTWNRIDGTGERQRFRAGYAWDLAKLEGAALKPGDVLEYHLLAKDNFNLNGAAHPPVPSGKLRITIISQEQLADAVTNELRTIANQVGEIRNSQNRTKEETGSLAKETAEKPELDAADRAAAERLGNQQSTAASQAKQVAGKLATIQERLAENKSPAKELDQLAGDVKETLNNAAENPMKDAAGKIGQAHQQKQPPQQRSEALNQAQNSQQQASDQLAKALERMSNIGSLQQTIDRFKDLLAEQQRVGKETREVGNNNLGKKPEQMDPKQREQLDKAAEDQAKLSTRTEKALAELQKMSDQLQKTDPAASEAMKDAARTGQQQQVSPNQKKAAAAAKQNQQAGAQAAQKQAELGLEMIINNLREAERRKLEELSRKLEELQKQIATLIRRQAGHNLDNLAVQGPERLAKLAAEARDALLAKAERAKGQEPPAPQAGQLSPPQEQTERNARDIAKTAEDVPNGTEPAAHLVRAAGKMERAIVHLRGKQLPEAYEPPQTDALAALEEAKKIVDAQKQQVEQKREEQQKEAVRQAYIRIKTEQEGLNAETTRIDKVRTPEGTYPRAEGIKLNAMPNQQQKLADDTAKLEEALGAVGSVVYTWANKDIVASMGTVKADLAKPVTGVPTRAEQTRVVEQLDAMIRNLAIKPPDPRKFDARDQGGGGGQPGQSGPQLPAEAELKLLKELQQAVNKSTKTIDNEPKKDEPKLLALGGRQGELRNVLDQLLQKASRGEVKLGPEPDPKDQLPEEAGKEEVENQELDKELLDGPVDAEKIEKNTNLIGDRMGRSRQRLAINHDPGKVTQTIQERIVIDLDNLIQQAQQQQQQQMAQGRPQPGPGQRPGQPRPGEQAVAENQGAQGQQPGQPRPGGQSPAEQSQAPGQAGTQTDLSQQIAQSEAEWGQLSPRTREAVIEGASEQIVDKYRELVEDYYRGVATRGTERQ